jgi:hypothetical protein
MLATTNDNVIARSEASRQSLKTRFLAALGMTDQGFS